MRRTSEELHDLHTGEEFLAKLVDCYSLSVLAAASFSADGLESLTNTATAVALTDAGEAACASVAGLQEDLSDEQIRIGAFLAFYWCDLLVDVVNTDTAAIAAHMDEQLREGALRLPWLWGRTIDEAYLARFGTVHYLLDADDTLSLLADLPQGVFQVGDFITGPFGLLRSRDSRLLAPGRSGPVLGCTDPGCDALHAVSLTRPESAIRTAQGLADDAAEAACNEEPSEWQSFIRDRILDNGGDFHHDDFNSALLAPFLGNALSADELRRLTALVIEHHSDHVRELIPAEGTLGERFRNPPDRIVQDLDAAQCLQIALVASDAVLVETIEHALDEGAIVIPPTELRTPVVTRMRVYNGMYDVDCQLSSAGMRFQPRAWPPSVAMRLRRLIEQIYPGDEGREHLEWKLRGLSAANAEDRLDAYLATTPPEQVVRELVFESRTRLVAAFAHLRWGRFIVPGGPEQEENLIDRILWKLGANAFRFPSTLPTFWDRVAALRRLARDLRTPYGEAEREALRGPGTNLFVSFEELLELSVCFTTWALLHDHWHAGRRNRFIYTPQRARAVAASILDGRPLSDDETLRFDASGRNTLFPLARGFSVLADICAEARAQDFERFARPRSDFPHFVQEVGLEQFPFLSVHPVLDLRPDAADAILLALREVPSLLDRAGALDVRNRIPHNREPFPSADEIERAAVALEEVVAILESLGITASPHLYESETSDRFGRTFTRLVDYKGHAFELLEPSPLRFTEMPDPETPQLIFLAAHLPRSSEVLRFTYKEDSDYLDRWSGFPSVATLPGGADPSLEVRQA